MLVSGIAQSGQILALSRLAISQITNLTITTDVLLFGTDAVSDEVYTTIFKAVQKYI